MDGVGLARSNTMAAFWADLTKLAVKNEHLNGNCDRNGSETIIGTTRNVHAEINRANRDSHSRGRGGVNMMHGVTEERKHHESPHENRLANLRHNQASTQVTSIMNPEEETKDHPLIDSTKRTDSLSARDFSENLQPDPRFRRANQSSATGLWMNENALPRYREGDQSRSELRTSQSRERYFQSQISTLPGPATGLN
jgi:hypothetical protein